MNSFFLYFLLIWWGWWKVHNVTYFPKFKHYYVTVTGKNNTLYCKIPNCWILAFISLILFQIIDNHVKGKCGIFKYWTLKCYEDPVFADEGFKRKSMKCMIQTFNDKFPWYTTVKKWPENFQYEDFEIQDAAQ